MKDNRYSRAKRYACAHGTPGSYGRKLDREDGGGCVREAVLLSAGCPGLPKAHNCCGAHVEEK